MMLTNPTNAKRSFNLYVLSIFLALVAMPVTMGSLMALHPLGAWTTDRVADPLRQSHPIAILLIIFSGMGFAFWVGEVLERLGFRLGIFKKAGAWAWGVFWTCFVSLSVRFGLDFFPSDPTFKLLTVLLLGTWVPILLWYFTGLRKKEFA